MAAVEKKSGTKRQRRARGSGGIFVEADGVWRVDVEVSRDAVTGRRRRVSRTIRGTRAEAELLAAKLRMADHEQRLIAGKTSARSVAAVMEQYLAAIESGAIELAPTTVVTSRSAFRTMALTELPDGRAFGSIRLTKLTWREIEQLYAAMKLSGRATIGFAGAQRCSRSRWSSVVSGDCSSRIRRRIRSGRRLARPSPTRRRRSMSVRCSPLLRSETR